MPYKNPNFRPKIETAEARLVDFTGIWRPQDGPHARLLLILHDDALSTKKPAAGFCGDLSAEFAGEAENIYNPIMDRAILHKLADGYAWLRVPFGDVTGQRLTIHTTAMGYTWTANGHPHEPPDRLDHLLPASLRLLTRDRRLGSVTWTAVINGDGYLVLDAEICKKKLRAALLAI